MLRWLKEETEILKNNYPTKGTSYLKHILERSSESIRSKAYRMGIKNIRYYKIWIDRNMRPNLAYLYGVYIGDGSINKSKTGNHFQLGVKDKEFALAVLDSLRLEGLSPSLSIEEKSKINKKWSDIYRVSVRSNSLVDCLENIKLEEIKNSNRKIKLSFLKGLYESEGSYYIQSVGTSKRLDISNTDKKLILITKNILESLSIKLSLYTQKYDTNKVVYIISLFSSNIDKFLGYVKPIIRYKPSNQKLG